MWNVECGMWNLESGIWNLEFYSLTGFPRLLRQRRLGCIATVSIKVMISCILSFEQVQEIFQA